MTSSDIVIMDLALAEAEALERVARSEGDTGVYRELALAGFDALRSLTVRYQQLVGDRDRLREENRQLRERSLLEAGADDRDDDDHHHSVDHQDGVGHHPGADLHQSVTA